MKLGTLKKLQETESNVVAITLLTLLNVFALKLADKTNNVETEDVVKIVSSKLLTGRKETYNA